MNMRVFAQELSSIEPRNIILCLFMIPLITYFPRLLIEGKSYEAWE